MAVEINTAVEDLQIRHQPTQKWSRATTLLQIEGGYGVSLIESQMQEIEVIATQVKSLATLASAQEIQKALKTVDESLGKLLKQGTDSAQAASIANQAISTVIGQLTQLATTTGKTSQDIATQLLSLTNTLSALRTAITDLGSTNNSPVTGETDVFEALISITTPQQVQPCPLPNTTKSLVFSGRKDSLGRSFDIYWSFTSGNIAQGKYKILWAYNEFQKTGLAFKDKVLYLSCDTPIQVDVCAFY
jgi:hypothetical protein